MDEVFEDDGKELDDWFFNFYDDGTYLKIFKPRKLLLNFVKPIHNYDVKSKENNLNINDQKES